MTIRFGITPPSHLWELDLTARQGMINDIANSGFDHLFLADHVSFRNGGGADGFVDVAALSQLHPSINVMISIYLLPLRHPLPVARQLVSMDKVAPGRLVFGVGVGGEDRHEIEVCGVDPRTRGKRTNEALAIIRRLLEGEKVDFDGDHFQLQQARIRPRPSHPIPVIVGGRSDAALKRAALYGDGWIGVWCSVRRYREALEIIKTEAGAAGRVDFGWQHGYQVWLGVDEDRAVARQAVKEAMEAFYHLPFEKFEKYTPYGTPSEVAEQLAPYMEAGCRILNMKPCTLAPSQEVALTSEVVAEIKRLLT